MKSGSGGRVGGVDEFLETFLFIKEIFIGGGGEFFDFSEGIEMVSFGYEGCEGWHFKIVFGHFFLEFFGEGIEVS